MDAVDFEVCLRKYLKCDVKKEIIYFNDHKIGHIEMRGNYDYDEIMIYNLLSYHNYMINDGNYIYHSLSITSFMKAAYVEIMIIIRDQKINEILKPTDK